MSADTYRGWAIYHDEKPVPSPCFDWEATGPNYDAWTEDGQWCDNGQKAFSATRDGLIAEIDVWFEENEA